MKKLMVFLAFVLAAPAFANTNLAAELAANHAAKSYCRVVNEKVLPLNNQSFLVLVKVDGFRDGEYCSFGSGSDFFMLKLVQMKNGKLRVAHDNLFSIWTDGESMMSNRFTYRVLGIGNPNTPNNRHIEKISLLNSQTLRIVALEHGKGDGNNFPSEEWQYDIRLSDMKIIGKRMLRRISY